MTGAACMSDDERGLSTALEQLDLLRARAVERERMLRALEAGAAEDAALLFAAREFTAGVLARRRAARIADDGRRGHA